jgi:hypothetical protein
MDGETPSGLKKGIANAEDHNRQCLSGLLSIAGSVGISAEDPALILPAQMK